MVAIARREPEASTFIRLIGEDFDRCISAATYLEACIVIDGSHDPSLIRTFDDFFSSAQPKVEPVTHEQAKIAREAYRDFGKGSGHPARLNFGDCFSYALATAKKEALLYKGKDFTETDIRSALGRTD